jgi:hypothetical protein
MKFKITEKEFVNITRTNVYEVEAKTEEEALDMVMKGAVRPVSQDEFEEFENVEYEVGGQD